MNIKECRSCREVLPLAAFAMRFDVAVPVLRHVCRNCKRRGQNVRRHGEPEVAEPEAPLELIGFLPMGNSVDRTAALRWAA